MTRTKLIFAFGAHPGSDTKKEPGERNFFEMAVRSAIARANSNKTRLVVLPEFKIGIEPTEYFSEKRVEALGKYENAANKTIRKRVKLELENGVYPSYDWFDWGMAKPIVEVNEKTPGVIAIEPEKTTLEIIANIVFEMGYDREGNIVRDQIGREASIIHHAIISSHLRTREVAKLIEEISSKDPFVFIPRGFAHKGMATKFRTKYDVEEIEGSECVPRFQSEAIILSYGRYISQEELETFALFKVICQGYLDAPWMIGKRQRIKNERGETAAYRETMKEAKDLTRKYISDNYALTLPE